jgi:3-hydroxybutyryl-CoA dehydrogenase
MTRIGVVGAGTMGVCVSYAFALGGHEVVLVDNRPEALPTAMARIRHEARFARLVSRARGGPGIDEVLVRIDPTTDLTAFGDVGYVVENISEDWRAKQTLYRQLDRICPDDCVLAVNTSAIPITKLAAETTRADKVIGNHFMNPAHLMPLVEVVRAAHTSDSTLATSCALIAGIGKDSVVVADSSGFVTNRVLMLTVNEAIFVLSEGISTAVDVDRLFRQCFGHRMGPLETADLIGLDTVLYSLEVLQAEFGDPKYRPCPLLRRQVEAGWLGRKTGRGFHHYDELRGGDTHPAGEGRA